MEKGEIICQLIAACVFPPHFEQVNDLIYNACTKAVLEKRRPPHPLENLMNTCCIATTLTVANAVTTSSISMGRII